MRTFQDFPGGLLMNPCINIYDPVMTNLTHNFSAASQYTRMRISPSPPCGLPTYLCDRVPNIPGREAPNPLLVAAKIQSSSL